MQTVNPAPAFEMACPIVTLSHRLDVTAFEQFSTDAVFLKVSDITEDTFFVRVRNIQQTNSLDEFMAAAQRSISLFLMALNLATLGHFVWARNEKDIYPQFSVFDPSSERSVRMLTYKPDLRFPRDQIDILTKLEIRRAAFLFIALAEEPKNHVTQEYLKGIYHLGLQLFDLSFHKDAFANFYRSLEFFVADRILRVPKLKKELKDIQSAIVQVGLGTPMADEFAELYKIRGEQVMHAQRGQNDMTLETVMKMKVLTDGVMNKVYEPVWQAKMEKGRP